MIGAFLRLWENDKRTVIFVTHDVDEALLLSDTIYIIKGEPAKVCGRFEVEAPRSARDLADDAMLQLRKEIYKALS
jgi:NitT/TauT family transport system ATP-binding protein